MADQLTYYSQNRYNKHLSLRQVLIVFTEHCGSRINVAKTKSKESVLTI